MDNKLVPFGPKDDDERFMWTHFRFQDAKHKSWPPVIESQTLQRLWRIPRYYLRGPVVMVIQWCTEEELCDVRQDKASERRTKWSVWSEYRMMIIGGHHTPCPVLGILKASPGLPKFSHRSHGIDPREEEDWRTNDRDWRGAELRNYSIKCGSLWSSLGGLVRTEELFCSRSTWCDVSLNRNNYALVVCVAVHSVCLLCARWWCCPEQGRPVPTDSFGLANETLIIMEAQEDAR